VGDEGRRKTTLSLKLVPRELQLPHTVYGMVVQIGLSSFFECRFALVIPALLSCGGGGFSLVSPFSGLLLRGELWVDPAEWRSGGNSPTGVCATGKTEEEIVEPPSLFLATTAS
jgi:hypothetical protein